MSPPGDIYGFNDRSPAAGAGNEAGFFIFIHLPIVLCGYSVFWFSL